MNELLQNAVATGVGEMEADAAAEYYTLDGRKISAPVKGQITIIRRGAKVVKGFVN